MLHRTRKLRKYLWWPNPYGSPRTPFGWLWLNVRHGNLNGDPVYRYLPEVLWWCLRHPVDATSTAAWSD